MLITKFEADKREERTIRQLLAEKKMRKVTAHLTNLHPADIADYLEDFNENERRAILSVIDDDMAVKIIQSMDDDLQFEMALVLGKERLVNILDALPSDEVVDILGHFSTAKIEELLAAMEDDEAAEAKVLLRYDEESAGGIMSADAVYFDENMDVRSCVIKIRENREDLENLSYLYITDSTSKLTGIVTVKELIMAEADTILRDIMTTDHIVAVRLGDDQEEVAKIVSKYDLLAIPVLDENDRLVGIVHVDDVIDVLEEEATEDMYRMVGLDEDVEIDDSALTQTLSRIRWLVATIVGCLAAGGVIKLLRPTDPALANALSAFIPAIMGLGGGVAIQSATVLIRGLATGEIEQDEVVDVFKAEVRVSVLLGLAIGVMLFFASFLWEGAVVLSAIIGATMLTQCIVAVALGLLIPVGLNSMGVDPAVAAGPLTQMSCDVTGMLIYYGYANLTLRYLGKIALT